MTGYQREFAFKLSETFPIYPLELPISVSGILDMIVKVGLVAGAQEKGWDLGSKLLRKLAIIRPITRKLKAYVEIDLGGPVSFGAYSYITDALHLLGLSTLYDEVKSEWLTPNLSRVLDEKPDVIFYEAKMYSSFDEQKLDLLFRKRRWSELDVVKKKQFFLTPGPLDFLAHHGPSFIIETLPWLADRLRLVFVNEYLALSDIRANDHEYESQCKKYCDNPTAHAQYFLKLGHLLANLIFSGRLWWIVCRFHLLCIRNQFTARRQHQPKC